MAPGCGFGKMAAKCAVTCKKVNIFSIIFHIDRYLAISIAFLGSWSYAFLFVIIFAETGLVVTPFLPGDSLLFAAGALASINLLNIWIACVVMFGAAVLGDMANYWIGYYVGPKVFYKKNSRIFNREYLEKTEKFYEKHGGKTIVLARFIPILRTFAPFVAGVGKMRYRMFFFYNMIGAFAWVTFIAFAGYFFGAIPLVKENFEYVVIGIIIVSLIPVMIEYIRHHILSKS